MRRSMKGKVQSQRHVAYDQSQLASSRATKADFSAARELEYLQTQRLNHIGESGMRASLGLATMRQQRYKMLETTARRPMGGEPAHSSSLIGSHQELATTATAEVSRDAALLSSDGLRSRYDGIQKINEDQEYSLQQSQRLKLVEDTT